jgi:hypothetical protein
VGGGPAARVRRCRATAMGSSSRASAARATWPATATNSSPSPPPSAAARTCPHVADTLSWGVTPVYAVCLVSTPPWSPTPSLHRSISLAKRRGMYSRRCIRANSTTSFGDDAAVAVTTSTCRPAAVGAYGERWCVPLHPRPHRAHTACSAVGCRSGGPTEREQQVGWAAAGGPLWLHSSACSSFVVSDAMFLSEGDRSLGRFATPADFRLL